MVEGLFANRKVGRVSFGKGLESGRVLYKIKGRGGGFWQMCPPSSSSRAEQRRGVPAAQGTAAAGVRGERGRGPWGVDSPPQF